MISARKKTWCKLEMSTFMKKEYNCISIRGTVFKANRKQTLISRFL